MPIHQLNVQYLPEQDRILARINTTEQQEFRLWLTRRLCLGWLPALRKLHDAAVLRSVERDDSGLATRDPKVREMLGEFERQRQIDEADFKSAYAEPAPGSPTEELLVSELSMTPQTHGPTQFKFGAKLPEGAQRRELQLTMDARMLAGFLHLLEQAFQMAQWDGASAATSADASQTPQAARPQYLN